MKPSILDTNTLKTALEKFGEKKFRISQIEDAIYKTGVLNQGDIKGLPELLRLYLKEEFDFETLVVDNIARSTNSQTVKFLFRTRDGLLIESVLMFHLKGRITLCVSSQVGCAMNCDFCATGKLGLARNLEWPEIIDQYLMVRRWMTTNTTNLRIDESANKLQITDEESGEDVDQENDDGKDTGVRAIRNIVFMGMGEPLANKDNVFKSLSILTDQKKIGLGSRRITISTVGIIPAIDELAEKFPQVKLAISLHAPTSDLRGKFMPVEKKFNLDDLMVCLDKYSAKTGKRIFYEYVMLYNFNDKLEDAHDLGKLLEGRQAHVNLIPWNQVEGSPFKESNHLRQKKFQEILETYGIPSTIRANLGRDIEGACGQLARRYN